MYFDEKMRTGVHSSHVYHRCSRIYFCAYLIVIEEQMIKNANLKRATFRNPKIVDFNKITNKI